MASDYLFDQCNKYSVCYWTFFLFFSKTVFIVFLHVKGSRMLELLLPHAQLFPSMCSFSFHILIIYGQQVTVVSLGLKILNGKNPEICHLNYKFLDVLNSMIKIVSFWPAFGILWHDPFFLSISWFWAKKIVYLFFSMPIVKLNLFISYCNGNRLTMAK